MSKKNLFIYGSGRMSSLAWYCLKHDSDYLPIGFVVDAEYRESDFFEGLPIYDFARTTNYFEQKTTSAIVPIGYTRMNHLRRERFEQLQNLGYECISYISSRASVWPDLQYGCNTMIYEGSIIHPFCKIGRNTIIRNSVSISHHCEIADHCFIASGVILGGGVNIAEHSFIGLGAIIRDGIQIAPGSFIGAGAVVLKNTESNCVYVGNPAKRIKLSAIEASCR